MTNNDSITAAARIEAARRDMDPGKQGESNRAWFVAGAEWQAARKPTDAEVEAAARALAYWDGASGWGTPAWDGEIAEAAYIYGARTALSAARKA